MISIKEKRKRLGLTQDALAKILGIQQTTVAAWEKGAANPRADKLIKLAKIFGCTIDELIAQDEGAESGETP